MIIMQKLFRGACCLMPNIIEMQLNELSPEYYYILVVIHFVPIIHRECKSKQLLGEREKKSQQHANLQHNVRGMIHLLCSHLGFGDLAS